MGKGRNSVPDRWEEYSNMGRQIPGTRFIAFKVPLRESILCNMEAGIRVSDFTPRTLRDHCTRLGLVLDLTNTDRYYDPEEFRRNGIEHVKLKTEGHIIPKTESFKMFSRAVEKFLEKNKENNKLIGVHCTHGLNRTGYMVCRFMIQKLKIAPDQAIADFNSARGHVQERENYLADLRQAPWIHDNYYSEDENENAKGGGRGRRDVVHKVHYSTRKDPFNEDDDWEDLDDGATDRGGRLPPFRRWSNSPRNGGAGRPITTLQRRRPSFSPKSPTSPGQPRGGRGSWGRGGTPRFSPYSSRKYYEEYYRGPVQQQYDPYFYQQRASGVGPHRPQPRWQRERELANQGALRDGRPARPRQYEGPRPYRSPPRSSYPEEDNNKRRSADGEGKIPLLLTPRGYQDSPRWSSRRSGPLVNGPSRHPFSPGARDNIFSPDTPSRRTIAPRWAPY
ncbi:uncharacterized protein LOC143017897 isoform X2 [Oratosquilla oratoria]|uniref:uncharacterized protein LOC143017897 isoform X2 n=1 Tax=Oratosquilla oratoria TaxID=337810 RepID=UPI003F764ECC